MSLLIAIPVKPFGVAKARLSGTLSSAERSSLGKQIALRTAQVAQGTGARVAFVTGSDTVARWAANLGFEVIRELAPRGLDGAAADAAAAAASAGSAWMILHADLPLLATEDLGAAVAAGRTASVVIAPSRDGGTSLLNGRRRLDGRL